MANYIGNIPSQGEFKKLDSIASSFDGSTTQFNLNYNSVSQSVGGAEQLIVSLNGVIQEPLTSYTLGIGGSSIVFASAPASGDTCHIVLFGGIGGTLTPSDQSVTAEKLAPELKDYYEDEFTADGSTTDFTLSRESVGVNQLMLTVDGVVQPTSAYSASGTTLTISPALPNGTNIRVVHMGVKSGVFLPQAGSVGLNELDLTALDGRYYTETEVDATFETISNVALKAPIANPSFTGNVGIGTNSPINNSGYGGLSLNGTNGALISLMTNGTESGRIASLNDETSIQSKASTGYITFVQGVSGGSEKMRIDSSGNLLVAKTAANNSTVGVQAMADGSINATVTGDTVSRLNRLSTDGEILRFQKDTTTIGSIGVTDGDNLFISSTASAHGGLKFNNTAMAAYVDGSNSDNTMDVGTAAVRFKNLYLSGGVYLGGTGSANHLDDYEEGSVANPINVGGTDITSYTGGYNYAIYVKVGRHVIFHVASSTTQSGPTGNVAINLPFMPAAQFTQEINYYDDGYYKRTGWATGGTARVEVTDININNRISRASSASNIIIRCTFSYYTNS